MVTKLVVICFTFQMQLNGNFGMAMEILMDWANKYQTKYFIKKQLLDHAKKMFFVA